MTHDQLAIRTQGSIDKINYPLTEQNKAAKAKEIPDPDDAASRASAAAANAFVDNLQGPNPFAGLSRDQLSTIANDDSGTFTTNERYAAYRQAYDEEQQWRSEAVAKAIKEYEETGKLTNFFKSALAHFGDLPDAEKSLYPEDYAIDLQQKIDLDFNYFTHMPHGLPGKAEGSIADITSRSASQVADLIKMPDIFAVSLSR